MFETDDIWYKVRGMLGEKREYAYCDAGSLKLTNETESIMIHNGYGDGQMRYAILNENDNLDALKYMRYYHTFTGHYYIHSYDCEKKDENLERCEEIDGTFQAYYYDGIVALVQVEPTKVPICPLDKKEEICVLIEKSNDKEFRSARFVPTSLINNGSMKELGAHQLSQYGALRIYEALKTTYGNGHIKRNIYIEDIDPRVSEDNTIQGLVDWIVIALDDESVGKNDYSDMES